MTGAAVVSRMLISVLLVDVVVKVCGLGCGSDCRIGWAPGSTVLGWSLGPDGSWVKCQVGAGRAKVARSRQRAGLPRGKVAVMRILRLRWPRTMRAAVCAA